MNGHDLNDTLYRVTAGVLEQLALMFLVPEDEAVPSFGPRAIALVRFEGEFSGSLIVSVGQEVLEELTGNMLGLVDPSEATSEQQFDSLKELANVLCGNLLPEVAGPHAVFHIGAPEQIDLGTPTTDEPVATTCVYTDTGDVELLYCVNDRASVAAGG
jgi:chemotaxis protein CheX